MLTFKILPLSEKRDMIRNRFCNIFHELAGELKTYIPDEQLFVYETQGTVMDAFFRHYLTMKISHIPKQGQVYEEFKLHHLNCEFNGQDRDMDVIFATDCICLKL